MIWHNTAQFDRNLIKFPLTKLNLKTGTGTLPLPDIVTFNYKSENWLEAPLHWNHAALWLAGPGGLAPVRGDSSRHHRHDRHHCHQDCG